MCHNLVSVKFESPVGGKSRPAIRPCVPMREEASVWSGGGGFATRCRTYRLCTQGRDLLPDLQAADQQPLEGVPRPRVDPPLPVRGLLLPVGPLRQAPPLPHQGRPARVRALLRGEAQEDLQQRHQEPASVLAGAAGALGTTVLLGFFFFFFFKLPDQPIAQ